MNDMEAGNTVVWIQTDGGCIVMGSMFSLVRIGSVIPIESPTASGYVNIIADRFHPVIATTFPACSGLYQQNNASCHKVFIIELNVF